MSQQFAANLPRRIAANDPIPCSVSNVVCCTLQYDLLALQSMALLIIAGAIAL
jgi:hypothetical protein